MSDTATVAPRAAGAVHLLCAGAAQGLVKALQDRFTAETGAVVQARFGAVGALKEALLAGEPCDAMVVTAAMSDALCANGRLRAGTQARLGTVATGIAVPIGMPHPDVRSAAGLRTALQAADAIHFPDPVRSTAGIHFADVMRRLGVHDALQPRFRTEPNGAAAMRELAAAGIGNGRGAIGCTQLSEILYTPGVALVAALPEGFGLETVYCAALSASAAQPALAARLVALLTGPATQDLRASGGFEL